VSKVEELKRVASTKERLEEAMREAGKKQTDLVKATGLNKSIISRCVSGKNEPGNQTIMLLAQALNVSEMWLWGYDVPKARATWQKKNDTLVDVVARMRNDPEFFDVVSMLAELPADQYASIKQLISALGNK
jgi:ribosome-binding protein aMBF1 (putative translation factor)